MATFYEVKKLLCRLFRCTNINDDNDDVVFEVHSFRGEQENVVITISNSELQELYDKVSIMGTNGLELYSENNYEIALNIDYPIMRWQEFPLVSDDSVNGINYEIGYPTIEYSLYLLMLIIDMNHQQGRRIEALPVRLQSPSGIHINGEMEDTLETILPKRIGEFSLKIKNTSADYKSLDMFRKMKTSFIFEFMYKTGNYLIEFLDILDMFPINRGMRRRANGMQIDNER